MQKNILNMFGPLPDFLFNLIILCTSVALGMILKWVILRLTSYYRKIQNFSFIKSTVIHLGGPLNFFLPLIFLNIFTPLLRFPQYYIDILNKSVEIGLIIAFAYILINLIKVVQDFVISTYDLKKENNLRERKIRTQLQF